MGDGRTGVYRPADPSRCVLVWKSTVEPPAVAFARLATYFIPPQNRIHNQTSEMSELGPSKRVECQLARTPRRLDLRAIVETL